MCALRRRTVVQFSVRKSDMAALSHNLLDTAAQRSSARFIVAKSFDVAAAHAKSLGLKPFQWCYLKQSFQLRGKRGDTALIDRSALSGMLESEEIMLELRLREFEVYAIAETPVGLALLPWPLES